MGLTLGFFVFGNHVMPQKVIAQCPQTYKFINDTLGCEKKFVVKKTEYTLLAYDLEQEITSGEKEGKFTVAAVYFRDLGGGPTFGINSDQNFVPASLLKLPLLVTYLSLADNNPKILSEKTFYSKVNNEVEQTIDQDDVIKINTKYTIDELLNRMIINSDNLAYGLLVKHLETLFPEKDIYNSTLKELGLVDPRNPSEGTFSVKTYASLFRQLYFASYLSPEMSEKALSLLSKTSFNKALVAGVPNGIAVAHKFGDREGLPHNEKQFHDCGIIYYPKNPYLLCVMTRGTNEQKLVDIIKSISSKVYDEVNSRKIE